MTAKRVRKPATSKKKPAPVVASYSGSVASVKPRVLFEPADELKPVRPGSKQEALIDALRKGATIDDLAAVTGWARSAVSGAFRNDVRGKGYGMRVENDPVRGAVYLLIDPTVKKARFTAGPGDITVTKAKRTRARKPKMVDFDQDPTLGNPDAID
jgi:hypothetical protein